jgi:hypothetical protein
MGPLEWRAARSGLQDSPEDVRELPRGNRMHLRRSASLLFRVRVNRQPTPLAALPRT